MYPCTKKPNRDWLSAEPLICKPPPLPPPTLVRGTGGDTPRQWGVKGHTVSALRWVPMGIPSFTARPNVFHFATESPGSLHPAAAV